MKFGRLLTVGMLVALPVRAFAQISLSITTEVDSTGFPDLAVTITVANSGKESAHKLHPAIQAGSAKVAIPELLELKPNSNHRFAASVRSESPKTGTYPLFVTVGYSDANGYNFSAIATNSYSAREASSSDIFGILTAGPISDEGDLRLRLKNNSLQQQQITLTPFMPAELSAKGLPATVTLAPGAEQEVTGSLSNFSALGGSRYPVFITAEYEAADRHYTSVINTMVDVVPRGSRFGSYRSFLIGVAFIFLLAAIGKMMQARKRSSSARVGGKRS